MTLTYLYHLFSLISAVVFVYAASRLHFRFRLLSTLCLVISLTLLSLYHSIYVPFFDRISRAFPNHMSSNEQIDWLVWSMHSIVSATLELAVAISFLCFVLAALRPNNSFKPKPLRGSA